MRRRAALPMLVSGELDKWRAHNLRVGLCSLLSRFRLHRHARLPSRKIFFIFASHPRGNLASNLHLRYVRDNLETGWLPFGRLPEIEA